MHIAAKKNQIDIATTLLECHAKTNCESNAGFTSLLSACQEGHSACSASKNGLTPLHLCAQEDKVNFASVLVNSGSIIDPQTKVIHHILLFYTNKIQKKISVLGWLYSITCCLSFWSNKHG